MTHCRVTLLWAGSLAVLLGCGQEVQTTGRRAAPGAKVPSEEEAESGGPASTGTKVRHVGRMPQFSEQDFIEDNEANRDPFRDFLKPVQEAAGPEVALEDTRMVLLDRYELSELNLVGIVGRRPRYAMIRAPDGRTASITKGVRISKSKALVVDIADDHVILQVPQVAPGKPPSVIERILWVDPNRKTIEITAQPLRPDEQGLRYAGWRRRRYLRRRRHKGASP